MAKEQQTEKPLDLTGLLTVPKQDNDQARVDKIIKASTVSHNIYDVLTLILVRVWKPLLMLATIGLHNYTKARHQSKANINNEE